MFQRCGIFRFAKFQGLGDSSAFSGAGKGCFPEESVENAREEARARINARDEERSQEGNEMRRKVEALGEGEGVSQWDDATLPYK